MACELADGNSLEFVGKGPNLAADILAHLDVAFGSFLLLVSDQFSLLLLLPGNTMHNVVATTHKVLNDMVNGSFLRLQFSQDTLVEHEYGQNTTRLARSTYSNNLMHYVCHALSFNRHAGLQQSALALQDWWSLGTGLWALIPFVAET